VKLFGRAPQTLVMHNSSSGFQLRSTLSSEFTSRVMSLFEFLKSAIFRHA
jgi:hypothetical protein